jgi:hypothetical protein
MSSRNTKPLENRANNSYNYILNNFVNGLAKKGNNKNGENVINKGKTKNNSDGSDDSNNIDNDDFGDGDSSNSNKSNKACGCIGWRGLPTPITS